MEIAGWRTPDRCRPFSGREGARGRFDIDDGIGQGGWFDPQTNTQYALYAYTLKKRAF
jgi:hypothetical protein